MSDSVSTAAIGADVTSGGVEQAEDDYAVGQKRKSSSGAAHRNKNMESSYSSALSISPPVCTQLFEWSNSDHHARVLSVPLSGGGGGGGGGARVVRDISSHGWTLVCTL